MLRVPPAHANWIHPQSPPRPAGPSTIYTWYHTTQIYLSASQPPILLTHCSTRPSGFLPSCVLRPASSSTPSEIPHTTPTWPYHPTTLPPYHRLPHKGHTYLKVKFHPSLFIHPGPLNWIIIQRSAGNTLLPHAEYSWMLIWPPLR